MNKMTLMRDMAVKLAEMRGEQLERFRRAANDLRWMKRIYSNHPDYDFIVENIPVFAGYFEIVGILIAHDKDIGYVELCE